MLIALIIADLLMVAGFIWRFSHLPPQIPLFYSELWGENQLVDFWVIALLPIVLHVFFFMNAYIYRQFFWQNQAIKHIINVANWAVILVFTSIFLRILFLVT